MIKRHITTSLLLSAGIFFLTACSPETVDGGFGITQPAVDAGFTVTKISENKYHLKRNYNNYLGSQWNIDGGGFAPGKEEIDVFFPDKGTYTVQHNAIGIGGQVGGTASHTFVIATSDPIAGNIVQGGKFETADDISKWFIHSISPTKAQWVFANKAATIVASESNQQAIYTQINVEAGKQYTIDLTASSASALEDTWFEVYVLNSLPAAGQDVSGTVYRNINTWDGCGKAAFGGKISAIGCGSKNAGVYTATATGPVYLVIKCGGKTVNGLTIDNVEVRRTQ
jgi:hypothetical protein